MAKLTSVDKKIEKAENLVRRGKEKLAKLRKKRPLEPVADYALTLANGRKTSLSKLFGRKKELILIHNMGTSCPYCTLWADGFKGLQPHLENRAAFALESPDRSATLAKFAKRRGWNYQLVSSRNSSFRKDMGFASKEGPWPGVSTFVKKGSKLYRVAHAGFGPGDNFCVMWDFNDLLPKSGWQPKYFY